MCIVITRLKKIKCTKQIKLKLLFGANKPQSKLIVVVHFHILNNALIPRLSFWVCIRRQENYLYSPRDDCRFRCPGQVSPSNFLFTTNILAL